MCFTAIAATASAPATANPSIPGSSTGKSGLLWVPNYGTGAVFGVDATTMKAVKRIDGVGDHPMVIKANNDGSKLFVGNFGPFDWSVSVIDTRSARLIRKLITLGPAYAVIQMSRNGRRLYVPTAASVVHVYDTTTLQMIRTIPVALPPGIAHIEVSDDERFIYSYAASGQITKYDARTGLPVALPLFIEGITPGWGATSVDESRQYAINFFDGVSIIDAKNWRVIRNVHINPWNANPISATLTPDGSELWVCNYSTNDIRILDPETGEEKRRVKTRGAAVYVGFSDDGRTAYLSELDDGVPLIYASPLVNGGMYSAKHQAWFAQYLNIDARVVKYDTSTLERKAVFERKGAFVAGVYPA